MIASVYLLLFHYCDHVTCVVTCDVFHILQRGEYLINICFFAHSFIASSNIIYQTFFMEGRVDARYANTYKKL